MVVLDAVVVVEIVDHDAEGFLDRTELGVAEPVDPLEPRAVAEVKAGYRVDAISGRWPSRQVGRTKPHQGGAQLLAPRRVLPPALPFKFRQLRRIGIASIRQPLREPAPEARYRRQRSEESRVGKEVGCGRGRE